MSLSGTKKLLPVAAVFVLVVALLIAAAPYFASTNLVRDRIALQISHWSGYTVTIEKVPELEVFPSLKANLESVKIFRNPSDSDPLLSADRMEARLSLLSAFSSEIDILELKIVRPLITVEWPGSQSRMDVPARGKVGEIMRALSPDRRSPPQSPKVSKLGKLEIVDGQISLGALPGEDRHFTSVNMMIDWPNSTSPLKIDGRSIWNGESFAFQLNLARPVPDDSGNTTPFSFTLRSQPLSVRFQGEMSLISDPFYEGKLEISSPSAGRALRWLNAHLLGDQSAGETSLSAQISGTSRRMKFEDVVIRFGDRTGQGVIDFYREEYPIAISSTLAFDRIDLLEIFTAFGVQSIDPDRPSFELESFEGIKVDLRLSATQATVGDLSLSNVALNIQGTSELAIFDIAAAEGFGGTIHAGLRFDRINGSPATEVRLSASDIQTASFMQALGARKPLPEATMNLSLIVRSTEEFSWNRFWNSAGGSFRTRLSNGMVRGLSMPAFEKRLDEPGFFTLAEISNGNTAFEKMDIEIAFEKGVGRIDKADLLFADHLVYIRGYLEPFRQSMALYGRLEPRNPGNNQDSSVFFVGGSPARPFISPIGIGETEFPVRQ